MRAGSERFNALALRPLGYVIAVGVGLAVAYSVDVWVPTVWAASLKLRGGAPDCPWPRVLSLSRSLLDSFDAVEAYKRAITVENYDEALGIELLSVPGRSFWIRRQGHGKDGKEILAYFMADHARALVLHPERRVRPGDIVLDCGAHVGVFTSKALELGAGKVVAIDPDPTQVECLRRNFREEIAADRVIVVPKGVWSRPGTMTLSLGESHSGVSSLVEDTGREKIEVAVTTIDQLVEELGLPRVDYIKLDIEGAEREALKGAGVTLAEYQPRLFIDTYHRKDDMELLPEIILRANPNYEMTCGRCEITSASPVRIVPHYVFYD